jgi:hypothetical protein
VDFNGMEWITMNIKDIKNKFNEGRAMSYEEIDWLIEAVSRQHLAELVLPIEDTFNGDNDHLCRSIEALIRLNDDDALFPHGIGGHARKLLAASYHRLRQNK